MWAILATAALAPTRGRPHGAISGVVAGSCGCRHVRSRALAAALVVGLLALVSGACEGPPARSKPWRQPLETVVASQPRSPVVAAEAARAKTREQRAHTLRVHVDRPPRHLNPLVDPSRWTMRVVADTVFETLIRYQPAEGGAGTGPGSYRPGLARSWAVSPGGREIRFELEPEAVFHDGRRMTSVDVQFSLDSARIPRGPADHLRSRLSDIVAVDILGPRTVRVRLARPNGYVLRAICDVPILSAQVYRGRLDGRRGPVVGTGPYRLKSWTDEAIELTRFDDYWGPAPAISTLAFIHEPDAARALTAAKRGELDIVPALIAAHYPEQASAPGLARDFAPLRLRPPSLRYLAMNASRPPLDDARVRHALALLMDRKTLIKDVHGGQARPVAGPIWPGGPGDGPAPSAPAYDPTRAGALLDEAGWRDRDGDGVRDRNGETLRLTILTGEDAPADANPALRRDADERDRIVRNLRRSGIQTERRVGPPAVLKNRLRDGDFDLAFIAWDASVDQDLSPLLQAGGELNPGRFSNPRVDALLTSLRSVWEPASRVPRMAELAQVLAETWPLAPIVAADPYGLIHRRVRGVVVWNGWISLRALSLSPGPESDARDPNSP